MNEPLAWQVSPLHGRAWAVLERRHAEYAVSQGLDVKPLIPAPPEGAPTYSELAEALRETNTYLPHFAVWCLNGGMTQSHADLTLRDEANRALLSRIPKETEP